MCFCLYGDCMYDFSAIINYIEYLRHKCGLFVSIHPTFEKGCTVVNEKLRIYNFHENRYCAFIKHNPEANKHCIQCQTKVAKHCEIGTFNGVCFAGVKERVYPITNETEVVGFISVSGYKTDNADSYLKRISHIYGFDYTDLKKKYKFLNPALPEANQLDTLLLPLCQMLELAYLKSDISIQNESLIDKVIQFVKQNYHEHITSEDICKQFYCSRSFMSTQFNKATAKSIREFINELRIADAKRLLKESSLSVTEIAILIGFDSSNYFSEIFKKQVGISPMKYRKASR